MSSGIQVADSGNLARSQSDRDYMAAFQNLGIVVKPDARAIESTLKGLLHYAKSRNVTVVLDAHSAAPLAADWPALRMTQMPGEIDLAVVIGGDGTLLHAGRQLAPHGIPILGINLGRLGFMVDVSPVDINRALDQILDGQFEREERLILETQAGADAEPSLAINEVVVRHHEYVRMLDFSTSANGKLISHHRSDGIIIATPTGSTAYALSAGGPMLHPGLEAMALVPISPHTLSDRPLILNAGCQVQVRLADSAEEARYTCDGQVTQILAAGEILSIQRSPHRLSLVHPPDYDYFSILRNKLHWGRGEEPRRSDR